MRNIIRSVIKRSLFPCFVGCLYAAALGYHPWMWVVGGVALAGVRARMRAEDLEQWEREHA